MKKFLALVLVMVMAISFAACGSKESDEPTVAPAQSQTDDSSTTSPSNASKVENPSVSDVAMETEDEYVVFNASLDFQLESDAWLGVIPTGTIYEKEADADEVDIAYVYCSNLDMDGATSHRFEFNKENFFGIADGTYDLVLCSSDNEEVGKVLLQIGMEKNGNTITLDYENNK